MGVCVVGEPWPMNPVVVEPWAGTEPFHAADVIVRAPESVPFHACWSVAPCTSTVHVVSGLSLACTITSPSQPPGQVAPTVSIAAHPVVGSGWPVGSAVGSCVGGVVGSCVGRSVGVVGLPVKLTPELR